MQSLYFAKKMTFFNELFLIGMTVIENVDEIHLVWSLLKHDFRFRSLTIKDMQE